MDTLPAISVLMPCYNAADTLPEALSSLRVQTWVDYELVVVDDGSTDNTPNILADWAQRDDRIHVLSFPHNGIVSALNAGLSRCRAEYIARMDADDRAYPERLARQLAYLQENPEVTVAGCLVKGFPEGQVRQGFDFYLQWINGLVTDEQIRREMFVESPLVHPSVIFRRQAVQAIGGYLDRGWPEDYDLWLRLYLLGAHFEKVDQVLLDWRESSDRLTRTDSRYSLENFLRLKAYFLSRGPLAGREAVIIWGAGMIGRRLSKHLLRQGCSLVAFIDIDPRKIGSTRRGFPILPPDALPDLWKRYNHPVILAAVGARGARQLIRQKLYAFGWKEGLDWWGVA